MLGLGGRWILASTLAGAAIGLVGPPALLFSGIPLAISVRDQRGGPSLVVLHVAGLLAAVAVGLIAGLAGIALVGFTLGSGNELDVGIWVALVLGGATGGMTLATVHGLALGRRRSLRWWRIAGAASGAVLVFPLGATIGSPSPLVLLLGIVVGGGYGAATAWPLTRGVVPVPS